MGNSASTRNFIQNNVTMKMTQEFVSKNIAKTTTNTTNLNYSKIDIGYAKNCPVTQKQSIFNKIEIDSNLNDTSLNELKNELTTALDNTVSQNTELINGAFNVTGGNNTSAINDVRSNINMVLTNTINKTNINKVVNDTFNQNTGEIKYLFCEDSPITVDQNIVSNIIARNILYTVGQALSQNEVLARVINEADQKAKQQNQGLNDIIDSIGKAITGPIGISIGGVVLFCCILIIAVIVLGMSPAGQNAAKKLSSKYG